MTYDHTTTVLSMPVDWVAPGNEGFWTRIWVSDEFKKLTTRSSWLRDEVIPVLAQSPVGFFNPPDHCRFYFSAWLMNSVMRRSYANPLIEDLYVLHEALHAATITNYYNPLSFDGASHALRVNEVEVSLETECWVYLRQPEWIGRTFDPLWIDQPSLREQTVGVSESPLEDLYEQLRHSARWPIGRHHEQWSDEQLWRVRRRMTNHAVSPADKMVQKYERMSVKWIERVAPVSTMIFDARLQLQQNATQSWKQAVDEWAQFGAQHVYHQLPFDHPDLSLSRRVA